MKRVKSVRVPFAKALFATAALAAASTFVTHRAAAQIAPLTQNRSVSARGSARGDEVSDSDFTSAPDFRPFDAAAEVFVFGAPGSNSHAGSRQQSHVADRTLGAEGVAFVSVQGCCGDAGNAAGNAESLYDVRFELAGETQVALTGQVSGSDSGPDGGGLGTSSVVLAGPGGTLYEVSVTTGQDTPLSYAAVLAPGEYRLTARADATGFAAGLPNDSAIASADYSLTFTATPEPSALAALAALLSPTTRRRRRSR